MGYVPSWKPTTHATPTGDELAFKFWTARDTWSNRTQTVAKLWVEASVVRVSICSGVAERESKVWSIVEAMEEEV